LSLEVHALALPRCDSRYRRRFVKLWNALTPSNSCRHCLSSSRRSSAPTQHATSS